MVCHSGGQFVRNHRRGVKGIGVILLEPEAFGADAFLILNIRGRVVIDEEAIGVRTPEAVALPAAGQDFPEVGRAGCEGIDCVGCVADSGYDAWI